MWFINQFYLVFLDKWHKQYLRFPMLSLSNKEQKKQYAISCHMNQLEKTFVSQEKYILHNE